MGQFRADGWRLQRFGQHKVRAVSAQESLRERNALGPQRRPVRVQHFGHQPGAEILHAIEIHQQGREFFLERTHSAPHGSGNPVGCFEGSGGGSQSDVSVRPSAVVQSGLPR